MKDKSLVKIHEELEQIQLDMEQAVDRTNSTRDLPFLLKKFKKLNRELNTNIQGSGTGSD